MEVLAVLRKKDDGLVIGRTYGAPTNNLTNSLHLSQAQTNETEPKELCRVHDRNDVLEGEYPALQRRYKEQEARVSVSD